MMWDHPAGAIAAAITIALGGANALRVIAQAGLEGVATDAGAVIAVVGSLALSVSGAMLFYRYVVKTGLETQREVIKDLQEERDKLEKDRDYWRYRATGRETL